MFEKSYEDRLVLWKEFRESLETTKNPFQDVIDFYNQSPKVSIHTDPYDRSCWPTPWELLEENQYCDFCRVLGMAYSLQLTDRFKESCFEIHIVIDNENSDTYYCLSIDDIVIGYTHDTYTSKKNLPANLQYQNTYKL